jgi:hypothetical protein
MGTRYLNGDYFVKPALNKIEVKISVPLEFTPLETVSQNTIVSGKKYRKQRLQKQITSE